MVKIAPELDLSEAESESQATSMPLDNDGFRVPVGRAFRQKDAPILRRKRDLSSASASYSIDPTPAFKLRAQPPRARVTKPHTPTDAASVAAQVFKSSFSESVAQTWAFDEPAAPGANKKEYRRQPGALSMESYMRGVVRSDVKSEAVRRQKNRVHERWEYGIMSGLNSLESTGDKRCRRMVEALAYLDTQGFMRSKQQRMMHAAMLSLSLEQYYGDELQAHLVRLLREYNLTELRTEGLFTAPRRFGKTVAIAMFTAAEIVTQPGRKAHEVGHDVLIYSNNQRASKMLLLQVYKMVKILSDNPAFGGRVDSLNKNESLGFITKDGWRNEVYAYPANEEKLRGTGSKASTGTVIAEEFAYMPVDLVFKIIGPTLTRKGVKFLGITTISGSDSFVTPLAEAKMPDGKPIMLTLNFELVCEQCKKKGRALQCKCLSADIPHWQTVGRHDRMQYLMASHPEIFLTEVKNVPIDQLMSPAFSRPAVDWLRSEEAIVRQESIYSNTVFTAVDPACGGQTSKFAIVSAIFHRGRFIVSSAALARCRAALRAARSPRSLARPNRHSPSAAAQCSALARALFLAGLPHALAGGERTLAARSVCVALCGAVQSSPAATGRMPPTERRTQRHSPCRRSAPSDSGRAQSRRAFDRSSASCALAYSLQGRVPRLARQSVRCAATLRCPARLAHTCRRNKIRFAGSACVREGLSRWNAHTGANSVRSPAAAPCRRLVPLPGRCPARPARAPPRCCTHNCALRPATVDLRAKRAGRRFRVLPYSF